VALDGPARANGLTLRLARDASITGRVLDQDGRPVAGASVRVARVWAYSGDGLDRYLEEYRKGAYGVGAPARGWDGPLPGQAESLTTDTAGRFRLTGLGRDWLVQGHIEGPSIQHTYFWAMTRPAEPVVRLGGPDKIFGASFDYLAAAARPIRGVVRARTTGKPLAGVRVSAQNTTFTTQTDKDGRFEILGCPKSPQYRVSAVPADGQPYFMADLGIADTRGLEPITADIDLFPGVPVLARVTDQATGKPVVGARVRYYPLRPNPHAARLSYREVEGASAATTGVDGSARLAALAGPGMLAAECAPGHPYMPALVTAKELHELFQDKEFHGTDEILMTEGAGDSPRGVVQRRFQALLLINPDAKADSVKRELTVQPGRVVTGTVSGPDGRPLAGAALNGRPLADASFKVTHLNPRRSHELLFEHKAKKLAFFLVLRGEEAGPLAVRLQPYGSVTGRVLDRDGQPLRGAVVHFCRNGSTDWEVNVKSGPDGKFRADGLVAGLKYWATLDGAFPDYDSVTIDPGKVKDLGDAGDKRPQ
jgi:protocatechuate 3,4-dioxygenase beta subunit